MNTRIVAGIIGLLVLAGGTYYAVAIHGSNTHEMTMTYTDSAPENASLGDGHGVHTTDTTQTERAFLEHMIPHHQEAVDSSKILLERSQHLELKALAASIITEQEKEITAMKTWYEAWYGEPHTEKQAYTPMMRDLTALTGTELDKAYIEDMIAHHTAALEQAQIVAPAVQHQETLTLAQAIAETQSAEIITMRIIQKQLNAATE